MQDNGRILAIHCHPDDAEFTCGGTLSLLRKKGYDVHIATMTAGNAGSHEESHFVTGGVRREEARKSAESIGAHYYCLEVDDLCVDVTDFLRRRVTGLIRMVDPFLIIAPPPEDYMFDHENTSRLVRDATFCAPIPLYGAQGSYPGASTLPYLYYTSPTSGHDQYGHFVEMPIIIDITTAIETKKAMLACHASQREWLRLKHGMDEYIESALAWSAETGKSACCAYAEGFRQYLGPYYPNDDILSQILRKE